MSISAGDIVINLSVDDKDMKVTFKEAGALLREFQGNIDKTAKSVKKLEDSQESLSTKFRHLVMTMGNLRFVAMDINDVFLRLPISILKTAGELERLQVLMTGLSTKLSEAGKAAEGAANFRYVIETAKQVPFEIGAIADSFVKMKTAGIDPTNGSMRALLDATAKFGGTGETLKRASVAIQQMAGKGVVSMEELRQQLGEAVPTAMQDMADAMGMSMVELTKAVSKGTVGAGTAIDKMLLRMRINNMGAADAMMDTWSGTLSRLKTEWELSAKFIADSGFADEAKKVVRELIDGLKSDEFKRFALAFGDGLGTAVRTLRNLAEVAHDYGGAITTLAGAWLLMKVNTGLVMPVLGALSKQIGEVRVGWQGAMQKANDAAEVARQSAIKQTQSVVDGLRQEQAERALAIERRQVMLAGIERQMEAHAARMQAIQAQINRAGALGSPTSGGALFDAAYAQRAKLQRQLAEENAAYMRNRDVQIANIQTINSMRTAHENLGGKIEATNSTLRNLEKTQAVASLGARTLTAATTALGFAFNAIGGWVGLVTVALGIGAWAWSKWGNAAEDAAKRAKRARMGLADADDLKRSIEYEESARQAYEDAKKRTADNYVKLGRGIRNKTAEERKKDIAAEQLALDEWKRAQDTVSKAKQSVHESNARDESQAIGVALDRVYNAIDKGTRDEITKQKAALADKVKNLKKDSKEYQDAVNESTRAQAETFTKGLRQQLAAREGAIKALEEFISKNGNSPEAEGARQRVKALGAEVAALNDEINHTTQTINAKNQILPGAEKGMSPAQRLLETLRADQAELQTELETYKQNMGDLDKAMGEAAKITARFKAHLYDEKGKDGRKMSSDQAEEAAELAERNQRLKEALGIAKQISTQAKGIEEDFKHAQEIFANPLGEAKNDGKLGGFDKMVAKLGANRQEIRTALQMTEAEFDQFVKNLGGVRGKLATIDLAEPYRQMVDETNKLGFDLILNERDRMRAQLEYDDRVFKARMTHRIEEAKAAGASAETIDRMEKALSENLEARTRANAQKLKTPMERLVDSWKDSTKQMQDATARWSQSTIDAFVNAVETGKFEWKGLVKQILADLLKIQMQKALADSMSNIMGSVGQMAMSFFGFKDGGIMSSFGSVPLKKYAAGGIANSPQMAVFGEGDMNEAYVPLPDGRRIPVALQGGGGMGNVVVNVINQTGQPVTAQHSQPRMDGKQMILDVVLAGAAAPGPFRDGMRNLMGA
jgi:tape measure domain-containing protein